MISFIIPTYNRADLLCEALSPLLVIREPAIECVVVDDCSTDGTRETVEALAHLHGRERLVYLRQDRNRGAQAARNRGSESARGNFQMFMDSDDVPEADGILALHRRLSAKPGLAYAYGVVRMTDAKLIPTGGDVGEEFKDIPREIAGYHWHTMGALYRRECVGRVGAWNPELTGSQDWEYQARVKLYGGKGEFVDTVVGHWRQHDGERVGTARFRPDYVRSVMLACESILKNAKIASKCDAALETRIAKRLVIHALEWGANGYPVERSVCLDQAVSCFSHPCFFSIVVKILSYLPAKGDGMLHPLLLKRFKSKQHSSG